MDINKVMDEVLNRMYPSDRDTYGDLRRSLYQEVWELQKKKMSVGDIQRFLKNKYSGEKPKIPEPGSTQTFEVPTLEIEIKETPCENGQS